MSYVDLRELREPCAAEEEVVATGSSSSTTLEKPPLKSYVEDLLIPEFLLWPLRVVLVLRTSANEISGLEPLEDASSSN